MFKIVISHRLFLFSYFPTTIHCCCFNFFVVVEWVKSKPYFHLRILNTNPCFYLLNESQIRDTLLEHGAWPYEAKLAKLNHAKLGQVKPNREKLGQVRPSEAKLGLVRPSEAK